VDHKKIKKVLIPLISSQLLCISWCCIWD